MATPKLYEFASFLQGDINELPKGYGHPSHPIDEFFKFIVKLDADVKDLKLSSAHTETYAGIAQLDTQGCVNFPRPFHRCPVVILSSLCYTIDENHCEHKHYVDCRPFLTAADTRSFSYNIFTGKLAYVRHAGWKAVNELHYICMAT